jgi:hypothetical protein
MPFLDDASVTRTGTDAPLTLHPDRLLPSEPGVRAIARRLYKAVQELPLICPHGPSIRACCSRTSASSNGIGVTLDGLLDPQRRLDRIRMCVGVQLGDQPLGIVGRNGDAIEAQHAASVVRQQPRQALLSSVWSNGVGVDPLRGTSMRS